VLSCIYVEVCNFFVVHWLNLDKLMKGKGKFKGVFGFLCAVFSFQNQLNMMFK